jgi:hypothetical protein
MTYGPIDLLALDFQTDQLKGEILPALLDLVEHKIVRVVDLVVIQKYEDGRHEAVEMEQLAPDLIEIFDPLNVEVSGIIQVEDIDAIAEAMENNTTAAVLLFENLWAIKFGEAVVRAKGRVLAHDRIPFEVINDVMDTFAQDEANA